MRLPMTWRNPIPMRARLARCWLFAYRTPADAARRHLPPPLEPVLHDGHAFWNVVVCRLHGMRPVGLPVWLGINYWQVAYRLYVRLPETVGRPARAGLWFARSDADHPWITAAGNVLTDFGFRRARVRIAAAGGTLSIGVTSPDAPARVTLRPGAPVARAPGSPFSSVEAASAALAYPPLGMAVDLAAGWANLVHIRRDEAAWRARPVHVDAAEWGFYRGEPVQLELAWSVAPIDYRWERGQCVPLWP